MDGMRTTGRRRHRMGGQSLVEFIIVAPIVLFMILFVVQVVMLYRIKATLDYAALEVARTGAVTGLDRGEMREALARGLTPLYARGKDLGALQSAFVRARADLALPMRSNIEIISPTRLAWDNFRERQANGQLALPNDSLAFRGTEVRSSGMNVQDANILKVKVTYQAPLIVPFVSLVLRGNSAFLESDMFEQSPVSMITGRLPVESSAIVRMQSPVVHRNRLDR